MESLQTPWQAASWGNPATPEDHEGPRPRSSTAPDVYHPPMLTVAHPEAAANARSSIHNADILFMEAPGAPIPPPPLPSDTIPPRLPYPEDYVSPNLRRARTAPPPVPPHPYRYESPSPRVPVDTKPPQRPPRPASEPHLPPQPVSESEAEAEPEPQPPPVENSREEDDAELAELAAVLALSQAETLRQEKLQQKMLSQEEADLARAMEASMSPNSWANSYSSSLGIHTTAAGSSSSQLLTPSTSDFPTMDYMDDAAFARLLAAQEGEDPTPTQTSFVVNSPPALKSDLPDKADPAADTGPVAPAADGGDLPTYSPRRGPAPLSGVGERPPLSDEELARQLAVEEEILAREIKADRPPDDPPDLPSYFDTKSSPSLDLESPALQGSRYRESQLTWVSNSEESPILIIDAQQRPASADTATFRLPSEDVRPASSVSFRSEENDRIPGGGANQFIDADLLMGVSIGFVAPSITPELVPLAGSMPNIISLPYGRCPPLHLQAPSWRHLLKLMARLSGTRIEPTVEALAVTGSPQMHLRTVVQFVRPHHSSSDWRTVLWFTIDHPVPTSMPGARKYTNGDVSVLPWSYTLSSVPTLLRDSSDSPLSKCYTIPSSDAVPFPALPITFPNMAMYLQAALEESRRHMSDGSSGMRKLAKMVETCYPTETEANGDNGERSRVDRLFKRVIGRGGRKDKSKKGKGGNEDTYELVTPFVLDEWGG